MSAPVFVAYDREVTNVATLSPRRAAQWQRARIAKLRRVGLSTSSRVALDALNDYFAKVTP